MSNYWYKVFLEVEADQLSGSEMDWDEFAVALRDLFNGQMVSIGDNRLKLSVAIDSSADEVPEDA